MFGFEAPAYSSLPDVGREGRPNASLLRRQARELETAASGWAKTRSAMRVSPPRTTVYRELFHDADRQFAVRAAVGC